MINGYTADDGLAVLGHLECMDLTKEDVDVFRRAFPYIYSKQSGNLIMTIKKIYCEIIPLSRKYNSSNRNGNGKESGHSNGNIGLLEIISQRKMKFEEKVVEKRNRRFDSKLKHSGLARILKRA